MSEPNKDTALRIEEYNKRIKNTYGCVHEKPKYRVVWSSNEFEYRRGDFKQVYFTAEDLAVKYVEKYNYCLDRWVLEKLEECSNMPSDLVTLTNFSYEPLYVFYTGENGDYEEPTYEQIERRIYFDIFKTLHGHKITEAKLMEMAKQRRETRIAKLREMIDNELPSLPHAMVKGSATFIDSRKKKVDDSPI